MKDFRVEIFENEDIKSLYFDDEIEAIVKATKYKVENPQSKVFLLERIRCTDNKYDVVTAIEP